MQLQIKLKHSEPYSRTIFPRLLHASSDDRSQFEISCGGSGIHWDKLDEDISVTGLLLGLGDQSIQE